MDFKPEKVKIETAQNAVAKGNINAKKKKKCSYSGDWQKEGQGQRRFLNSMGFLKVII